MLATGLLLVATFVASVTDVRHRRIYNWTTYPGIAIGLALNGLGSLCDLPSQGLWSPSSLGIVGWSESVEGFAFCGGVLLVGLALFNIGGGDVKLFAMIGAFLGVQKGLEVLLWSFVFGGIAAAVILIWRVGAVRLIQTYASRLWSIIVWQARPEISPEEKRLFRSDMWLAPCALVAVVLLKLNWLPDTVM